MTNHPKVSILIPLYNSEVYIAETLDTCLAQTYPNIEMIIVDDGSQDKSLVIAKEFENRYQNITVYAQENSGASTARNKAFSLSLGEYIQYLDADDLLHPDKIRLQIEALNSSDDKAIAFGTWGTFQKTIENVSWKELPVNKNYDDPKQFLVTLWASGLTVVIYAWLFPRSLIAESAGWNEKLSVNDDGEFSARIVAASNKMIYVKESRGYYRKDNANSLSKQVSKEALESKAKSFETYFELMKDDLDNPEVCRNLALFYSRNIYYLRYNHPEYKNLIQKNEEKIKILGYNRPLMTRSKIEYMLIDIIGKNGFLHLRKIIKFMIRKKN